MWQWWGVLFLLAISLFPLCWGLITSFKHPADVVTIPPSFVLTRPSLENYRTLIEGVGIASAPAERWLANSAFVSITNTLGTMFTASFASEGLARKRFPGRDAIFWASVATMLVPSTHQGSERPARKYCPDDEAARRRKASPSPTVTHR